MTPTELKAWRDRCGLTNKAAAEALAITPRRLATYLYNERPIPRIVAKIAQLLEAQAR